MMKKTKTLTKYMESLAEILTSDDNLKAELRREIIKRLLELHNLKKACRGLLRSWRKSNVGKLVQTLPQNYRRKND